MFSFILSCQGGWGSFHGDLRAAPRAGVPRVHRGGVASDVPQDGRGWGCGGWEQRGIRDERYSRLFLDDDGASGKGFLRVLSGVFDERGENRL